MAKINIGIAAGHSSNTDDPQRLAEHEHCRKAVIIATDLMIAAGIEVWRCPGEFYVLPNDAALRGKVGYFNNLPDLDALVEVHCNRGSSSNSTGYSVWLYWQKRIGPSEFTDSIQGKAIAQALANTAKDTLPWRSMGPRGAEWAGRGGLYWLNKTRHPAVITEAGFQDIPWQWDWLNSPAGIVQHGITLAQGLINYSRSIGGK